MSTRKSEKIVGPLGTANKLSDMPDFNDATKLGSGKEMVDRLSADLREAFPDMTGLSG